MVVDVTHFLAHQPPHFRFTLAVLYKYPAFGLMNAIHRLQPQQTLLESRGQLIHLCNLRYGNNHGGRAPGSGGTLHRTPRRHYQGSRSLISSTSQRLPRRNCRRSWAYFSRLSVWAWQRNRLACPASGNSAVIVSHSASKL